MTDLKPPFTEETALKKVKAAQDMWNTKDPAESRKDTAQHVSGVFEIYSLPGQSPSSRFWKGNGNASVIIDFGRNFSLSGMIA
ncbi:hypothetical protein PDIDSM_4477 [Penicillium digitatum]|nr:hypothetical protein PDIDSM_4477 [Penicillium digitatum]